MNRSRISAGISGLVGILGLVASSVAYSGPEQHHHMEGMDGQDHAMHMKMMRENTGTHKYTKALQAVSYDDMVFEDATGGRTSAHELLNDDRPMLVTFIFTSCGTICPILSATVSRVKDDILGITADAKIVSITIDPDYDTPERLLEYSRKYGVDEHWKFVRGDIRDTIKLEKAFGVFRGNKMNHEASFFVKAPHHDRWLKIDGFIGKEDLLAEYKAYVSK